MRLSHVSIAKSPSIVIMIGRDNFPLVDPVNITIHVLDLLDK